MSVTLPTPAERRADLARRVDFAREAIRPVTRGSTVEARLARRAWHVLADVASELVEDADEPHA